MIESGPKSGAKPGTIGISIPKQVARSVKCREILDFSAAGLHLGGGLTDLKKEN
jgi:hypothetical protein